MEGRKRPGIERRKWITCWREGVEAPTGMTELVEDKIGYELLTPEEEPAKPKRKTAKMAKKS